MDFNDLLIKLENWVTGTGIKLIIGLVILYIGWKVINSFTKKLNKIFEKRKVDSTLRSFLDSFVDVCLKVILIFVVLLYVGIAPASIAAVFASAGLAIGLALQGSLSNLAGGVIILFLRPFKVGDFVETSGYSGTVEHIKLFYTHLITPDNKEIILPNGSLSNGSLINYSTKSTRRVDLIFGVGYDDDILHVRRVLKGIIDSHNLIINHPEPFIGLSEHGASSVNFVVRVWCKSEDYWTIYFDLLEQVKVKFDNENISIPYPQMDVHLKKSE